MASSSCLLSSQICGSLKIDLSRFSPGISNSNIIIQKCLRAPQSKKSELFGKEVSQRTGWGFLGVPRTFRHRNHGRTILLTKRFAVLASWLSGTQIASTGFTLGTAAVLPFYTSMVVAPRSEFTKKLLANSIPYLALGTLYAYLLYLSWSPETIRLMFASKYWLPELQGIAKMFSSEMTLASAWIHLLAVDLFAARQIYFDGLQNNVEMRHSVSLCLLFCPIGIFVHFLTKALSRNRGETEAGIRPLVK